MTAQVAALLRTQASPLHPMYFSLARMVRCHISWCAIILAACLWALGIAGYQLEALSLAAAPFLHLGAPFWAGLVIAHLGLVTARRDITRYAAALLIAGYFWLTIPVIYPLGYMHDSARNVTATAAALYPGGAFPGFTLFVRTLAASTGMMPQTIDRLFPGIAFLVYAGLLAGLGARLSRLAGIRHDIGPLFLYATAVLGSAFDLRLNAAPQTLGYILFLFVIVLLLTPEDPKGVLLSVFGLVAIVVSHPISPLLALAGFYGILYLTRRLHWPYIVPGFVLLALVLYATWVLYRAGWVLTSAMQILRGAAHRDVPVPIVGLHSAPQVAGYLALNRIFLCCTLVVLLGAVGLVLRFQRRVAVACLLWGAILAPVFLALYGSYDFLDRVLLFAFVPAAGVFALAYTPILAETQFLIIRRTGFTVGLITLSLLSAATAYFYTASVDRVTASEITVQRFVARTTDLPVDLGGFQLPVHFRGPVLTDNRGTIDGKYYHQAQIIVLLQQARNAAVIRQGWPYPRTRLGQTEHWLGTHWNRVYDDGQDVMYAR